ncbi:MAG: hypothetical protein Q9170_006953 [Blastenia crenularia]
MRSFIISAVIGLATLGIQGINAAAVPKADTDVKRSPQENCWEAPDGQIHCALSKRHPCYVVAGQIRCSPEKRSPQENCWEAPDGQIHCSLEKRESCWEAPDGQIHCSLDKRETCWEAPDGQIHCLLDKRDALPEPSDPNYPNCGAPICFRKTSSKRDSLGQCWEAPDGQIHCSLDKRDALPEPILPGYPECGAPICFRKTFSKRDALEHCWEAPDGQIHCSLDKRDPQEPCWEAPDGQVHCSFAMEAKRDASAEPLVAPPPAPIANGTSLQCASWWTVVKLEGQPDPCLAALVTAQNITFTQFRQLNPEVNSTCTNLKVGYAYCIQASGPTFPSSANVSNTTSMAIVSSSAPLLPAVRVTEARSGARGAGLPTPTSVAQIENGTGSTSAMANATASHLPQPHTTTIIVTYFEDPADQTTAVASAVSSTQAEAARTRTQSAPAASSAMATPALATVLPSSYGPTVIG